MCGLRGGEGRRLSWLLTQHPLAKSNDFTGSRSPTIPGPPQSGNIVSFSLLRNIWFEASRQALSQVLGRRKTMAAYRVREMIHTQRTNLWGEKAG